MFRIRVEPSESQSPQQSHHGLHVEDPFPPITPEDIGQVGFHPQRIPLLISAVLRAERSPDVSPVLTSAEVETAAETIDEVLAFFPGIPLHTPTLPVIRFCHPHRWIQA